MSQWKRRERGFRSFLQLKGKTENLNPVWLCRWTDALFSTFLRNLLKSQIGIILILNIISVSANLKTLITYVNKELLFKRFFFILNLSVTFSGF
jgi:hypothetical protein